LNRLNRREKQDEIATRSIRNPGGRKPGAGKAEKLRAALIKELPEALEAQAKTGDTGAIKLVLERTVPELRPVDAATPLNLPAAGSLESASRWQFGRPRPGSDGGRFLYLVTYPNEPVEAALARKGIVPREADYVLVHAGFKNERESVE